MGPVKAAAGPGLRPLTPPAAVYSGTTCTILGRCEVKRSNPAWAHNTARHTCQQHLRLWDTGTTSSASQSSAFMPYPSIAVCSAASFISRSSLMPLTRPLFSQISQTLRIQQLLERCLLIPTGKHRAVQHNISLLRLPYWQEWSVSVDEFVGGVDRVLPRSVLRVGVFAFACVNKHAGVYQGCALTPRFIPHFINHPVVEFLF